MVYILMGVSGSGKTTVGRLLAKQICLPFYDGDDFHLPGSFEKMRKGIALEDHDRAPWLKELNSRISLWNQKQGAILACSALKRNFRRILTCGGKEDVTFILLDGTKEVLYQRMCRRKDHFFSAALLDSQFEILERPENAIVVSIRKTPEQICSEIISRIMDCDI